MDTSIKIACNPAGIQKVYVRNLTSQKDVWCENKNFCLPTGVTSFAALRQNEHLGES